jgi:hypothetical protein
MNHLHFTVAQLRRAYKQADAWPCRGTWSRSYQHERYRCPLNLIYDRDTTEAISMAAGIPIECLLGFMRGWDDQGDAIPNECTRCFQLGAQLRVEFRPIRIDG